MLIHEMKIKIPKISQCNGRLYRENEYDQNWQPDGEFLDII